jgi:hypothetical protein
MRCVAVTRVRVARVINSCVGGQYGMIESMPTLTGMVIKLRLAH